MLGGSPTRRHFLLRQADPHSEHSPGDITSSQSKSLITNYNSCHSTAEHHVKEEEETAMIPRSTERTNKTRLISNTISLWRKALTGSADPQRRNLRRTHLPDPDQVVDKVPGGVGLSVLLVGGVAHPDVVEAINTHLQGGGAR